MNDTLIAKVCHEVNRAYCAALGDTSHRPWDEAEPWQRATQLAGVKALKAKPTITPEESHEQWAAAKIAEGWTLGPMKDAAAKTHPALVPWAELSTDQRMKDHLFVAVAGTLLAEVKRENTLRKQREVENARARDVKRLAKPVARSAKSLLRNLPRAPGRKPAARSRR